MGKYASVRANGRAIRFVPPLLGLALAVGWVAFLRGEPRVAPLACVGVSWLLSFRRQEWAVRLSWLTLATALAPSASPALGAVMASLACAAVAMAGFEREERALCPAILLATGLVVVMWGVTVVGRLQTLSPPPMAVVPLWLVGATSRAALSPRVLSWARLPALPLAVWLLWGGVAGGGTRLGDAVPHHERPEHLEERLRVNPWAPHLWARLAELHMVAGELDPAYEALRKGYAARPSATNPCSRPLADVGVALGRWREVVRLEAAGHASVRLPSCDAAVAYAVEMWRQELGPRAREKIRPWRDSCAKAAELDGWLAYETRDDSLALGLLLALDAASGETMFRAAMVASRRGLEGLSDSLIRVGARRFPLHRRLRQAAGLPPPPLPPRRQGHGVVLGNAVRFLGWDASPDPARPGDTLCVRLAWEPTKPLPALQVILHLDHGTPPRRRVNADFWPAPGRTATAAWAVGEVATASTRVVLPRDLTPGRYTVYTGLWTPPDRESRLLPAPTDGSRMPPGEMRLKLGDVRVHG